jgi:hypothetical protein
MVSDRRTKLSPGEERLSNVFRGDKNLSTEKSRIGEEFCIMGCNAMYSDESRPTFRRKRLGLSCSLFHAGFLLCLLFNTEDGGDIFLRTVCRLSTDYTASYSPL